MVRLSLVRPVTARTASPSWRAIHPSQPPGPETFSGRGMFLTSAGRGRHGGVRAAPGRRAADRVPAAGRGLGPAALRALRSRRNVGGRGGADRPGAWILGPLRVSVPTGLNTDIRPRVAPQVAAEAPVSAQVGDDEDPDHRQDEPEPRRRPEQETQPGPEARAAGLPHVPARDQLRRERAEERPDQEARRARRQARPRCPPARRGRPTSSSRSAARPPRSPRHRARTSPR